jgi:hypothetical protein
VSSDSDDEALSWAGDRDATHVDAPVAPRPVTEPPVEDVAEDEALPAATSSILLITLGILGGVYLLFTVGWIVSLQRFLYFATTPLEQVAFSAQQYLAVIATPLWFVVSLLMTRGRKPPVRLVWLIVGMVLLVPWSFVLGS